MNAFYEGIGTQRMQRASGGTEFKGKKEIDRDPMMTAFLELLKINSNDGEVSIGQLDFSLDPAHIWERRQISVLLERAQKARSITSVENSQGKKFKIKK